VDDEPYNIIALRVIINAAFEDEGIYEIIDQVQNGQEAL
jgi:CheY-like chemotaxis protein